MSQPTPVTADIIPFPSHRPEKEDGQERLRRALAGLDNAIAGQRTAVATLDSNGRRNTLKEELR